MCLAQGSRTFYAKDYELKALVCERPVGSRPGTLKPFIQSPVLQLLLFVLDVASDERSDQMKLVEAFVRLIAPTKPPAPLCGEPDEPHAV